MGRVGRVSVTGLAAAAVRAPFTRRARRELAFCLLGLPFAAFVLVPLTGFFVTARLALLAHGPPWVDRGNPSWQSILAASAVAVLLTLLLVTTGAARALGAEGRRLAGWLLGDRVAAPPPLRPGRGLLGGLGARLRDGPGWRALAYLFLKLPVALLGLYAVAIFWGAGLVNLTYPFWWQSFRNHSPGVRLNPVTAAVVRYAACGASSA